MNTIDDRDDVEDQGYSPAFAEQIDLLPTINEVDEAADNLDVALHPSQQTQVQGRRIKFRPYRMTILVVDLAFAVLRKLA